MPNGEESRRRRSQQHFNTFPRFWNCKKVRLNDACAPPVVAALNDHDNIVVRTFFPVFEVFRKNVRFI